MAEEEPSGWAEYLAWVQSRPEWRRRYISRLKIETKDPRKPAIYFDDPHPLQREAQDAYEDPTVTLTVDVKGRQVGRSTQEAANQFATAHSSPGPYKVLIATNHQKTTDGSMRRYQFFVENLDAGLREFAPVKLNLAKSFVAFARNNAIIDHITVGGKTEGKSWGYHAVVAEEMGMWSNADVNWASIQATLPDDCPTHIISTPTGPRTLYARKVQEARRAVALGDLSVRLNFWPWFLHPEYRRVPPKDWEPDQAEADFASDVGIDIDTPEGLAVLYWRHQKVLGPSGIGMEMFRREYPSNIDEGFLEWAGSFFDLEWLNRLITLRESIPDAPAGEMRFYHRPQPGMEYAIGVDPSWCVGGDYAVAVVLDNAGRLCAVFATNRGGEVEFGRKVSRLAGIYSNAKVLVEANNVGRAVIRMLFNEGVRLWRDMKGAHPKDWTTGQGNRELMLSDLREATNTGAIDITDLQVLHEMTTFREKDGRLEGQDGEHDDHVFALGLAEQCRRSLPSAVTSRFALPGRGHGVQRGMTRPDPHTAARLASAG